MKKPVGTFSRDANNRLCFEMFDVDSLDYPSCVARIVAQFSLKPSGEMIVGLDQMFRDYNDGNSTVGLEWDNWLGFIVTAKTPDAETQVNFIGVFLTNL